MIYCLMILQPLKATFQRGAAGYTGTKATYFDGSGSGYNAAAYLRMDAVKSQKALLRFDLPSIPITATVDEATLRVYQTGRSNANGLTWPRMVCWRIGLTAKPTGCSARAG